MRRRTRSRRTSRWRSRACCWRERHGRSTRTQPAISLPLGHSDIGLPIGVQLIARHGAEDTLLRTAAELEAALPWQDRNPTQAPGRARVCLTKR